MFTDRPFVSAVISPSRCLQDQRDVVQSGLVDNVSESRDSDVTFTNVFVAIEIAAQFTCKSQSKIDTTKTRIQKNLLRNLSGNPNSS